MKRQLVDAGMLPHKRQRTETPSTSESWDRPLFRSSYEEEKVAESDSDSDSISVDEQEPLRTGHYF